MIREVWPHVHNTGCSPTVSNSIPVVTLCSLCSVLDATCQRIALLDVQHVEHRQQTRWMCCVTHSMD